MQTPSHRKTGLTIGPSAHTPDPEGTIVAGKGRAKKPEVDKQSLGRRLARLRRERGLTQIEMAEMLGVAQPVVSDYERGELRLHGELIIKLTHILAISADELLGLDKPAHNEKLGDRRFIRRLKEIDRLNKRDQQALLRTIDAFLGRAS